MALCTAPCFALPIARDLGSWESATVFLFSGSEESNQEKLSWPKSPKPAPSLTHPLKRNPARMAIVRGLGYFEGFG